MFQATWQIFKFLCSFFFQNDACNNTDTGTLEILRPEQQFEEYQEYQGNIF